MKRLAVALALSALVLTGCSVSITKDPTPTATAVAAIAVPDVTGQKGSDARKALKDAGFVVEFDAGEETVIAASNWTVDAQTPPAGTEAEEGSTVTLVVSKPGAAAPEPGAASTEGLAAKVEADLKMQWGVENFTDGLTRDYDTDMLNWYIASISDVSPGVIEIIVQVTGAETTKAEAKKLSVNVLNLTGTQFPELKWVMVQTADGKITQQSQRSEAPFLK